MEEVQILMGKTKIFPPKAGLYGHELPILVKTLTVDRKLFKALLKIDILLFTNLMAYFFD